MREGGLDAALAEARAGGQDGLRAMWVELNPRVLRYLQVIAAPAAQDAAHAAWLQAATSVRGFDGDAAAFRVWLFRTARGCALGQGTRRLRHPDRGHRAGPAARAPTAPPVHPATEQALDLIAALPPCQAEVLTLRVVAEMDRRQVAAVLGTSRITVALASIRALRHLQAVAAARPHTPSTTEVRP